jgi:hypothetical protein
LPIVESVERLELALGGLEAVEDRVGVRQQAAAVLGELDTARLAVEQSRAGRGLQGRDLARDSGLRVPERSRRGGDRSVARDLAQRVEPLRIHARSAW